MSGEFASFLAARPDVLQTLVDQAATGLVVLSGDARVVEANRRALDLAGTTRDALIGTDVRQLFPDQPVRQLLAAAGNGPPRMSTARATLRTGGGEHLPLELTLRRLAGGFSVLTWRESTQPGTTAEETLRDRVVELEQVSRWFRSVVEVSPVPHALNDDAGNITYLNPAFVRTFGYDLDDIPTLDEWWPRAYPDERYRAWVIETWGQRLEMARKTGMDFEPVELEIRAKDGSKHIAIASAASLGDDFAGTHLVLLYDVTKARRLQAERRALEERLAHAERMESIGRLAGGIAHDNNNALMVIMSQADTALAEVAAGTPVHGALLSILNAAEHSADLIRQLMAHARQQPVVPRVIDVALAVTQCVALLNRLIGENISLQVRLAPDIWPVRMDPSQVEQLLTNLCINARDAISETGKIVVTAENVVVAPGDSKSHADASPGDYVLIRVTDDGGGIPPDVIDRIFEPFFTTKELGRGTGLGLAMVWGIVKQNAGFIGVDSTPELGTSLSVYLPRTQDAPNEAIATETRAPSSPPRVTVLVIEDEAPLLEVLGRMLTRAGYEVLFAITPDAALRHAREHRGTIDVIVTDVIMPEMNGRELATRLLEDRPEALCLFMSGYTADIIGKHGVLDPGVHFLEKPFTTAQLDSKLQELLALRARGAT